PAQAKREQRLWGSQESLHGLRTARAMHQEQIRADGQAPSAAGRTEHHARTEPFTRVLARHKNQATSHGTIFCQSDSIRIRSCQMAWSLEDEDSGIPYL